MSLSFTGESLLTTAGTRFTATGSKGEPIVVEISRDAIHDYGEVAVQRKAIQKYEENQIYNGTVTVETSDFSLATA